MFDLLFSFALLDHDGVEATVRTQNLLPEIVAFLPCASPG